MKIRSLRRVTNDRHHNAFTGACWFKNHLFIAYRQGDNHSDTKPESLGRIIVLRSRDHGLSWDNVAVFFEGADMRDAHLYTDGRRICLVTWFPRVERGQTQYVSGSACSDDGMVWSRFIPYTGTGGYILWRPQYHAGKHYCAGAGPESMNGNELVSSVHWFESNDGTRWRDVRELKAGPEQPNECYLEILADGTATLLMRCEEGMKHPYLCRSQAPFDRWTMTRLNDISITGPSVWTVAGEIYIGVRWHMMHADKECVLWRAQTAIFKVQDGKTQLQYVLPSGPRFDNSYMGIARYPDNANRFSITFYSDGIAPSDPTVCQQDRPDIYLADVLFDSVYLTDHFKVSQCFPSAHGLDDAALPDPADPSLHLATLATGPRKPSLGFTAPNFLNISDITGGQCGVVYILRDIEVGPVDRVHVLLGYDGPVKVWWNGEEVFHGPGTNPALEDQTSLMLASRHGTNRLAIALDTNGGKASGIFARWEPASTAGQGIRDLPGVELLQQG